MKRTSASLINSFYVQYEGPRFESTHDYFFFFFLFVYFSILFIGAQNKSDYISRFFFSSLIRFRNMHAVSYTFHAFMIFKL